MLITCGIRNTAGHYPKVDKILQVELLVKVFWIRLLSGSPHRWQEEVQPYQYIIAPAVPADLKGASRMVDSDALTSVSHRTVRRGGTRTARGLEGRYEGD